MPKIQVERELTRRSVPLRDIPVGVPFRRVRSEVGIVFLRLEDPTAGNCVRLNGDTAGKRQILSVDEDVMELEVTMTAKDA